MRDDDADGEPPVPDVIELPIDGGELDLHAFAPRDVPSVVADFVEACRARGILRLRIVHGRGTGTQRAIVRGVLARLPGVLAVADAPPHEGGWGAAIVVLDPPPVD